ncbi:MAG: pyridoxamine 5'-phosphate oxidase [Chitinophagales bacterium]|nr:pyridoxamine 5'-phosphate oxidase [Chitinophagales bacterium]
MENSLLANLRKDYQSKLLDEKSINVNPLQQFETWFDEAIESKLPEPNAMTIATCGIDFKPSARIVLLKGIENGSFLFYTNYQSRKGKELLWNPYAALLFFWNELHRQVRIEGRVEKTSSEISDAYFESRPFGSQLSALVSPQSEIIQDRDWLEEKLDIARKQFDPNPLKRPRQWGGYRLIPNSFEFWQGRPNRLHDRILFTQIANGWKMERLGP